MYPHARISIRVATGARQVPRSSTAVRIRTVAAQSRTTQFIATVEALRPGKEQLIIRARPAKITFATAVVRIKRETIVLASAVLAALPGFYFAFRHPASPPEAAKLNAEALLARDAGALWSMADPDEVKSLGWTEDKAKTFLQRFVFPDFEGLVRESNEEKPAVRNGGDQGYYVLKLKTPQGHHFELEATANRYGDGTYAWFESLIVESWFLRYMRRHNVDFSQGIWIPARLEGLREDRAALEQLGLKGMYTGRDDRNDAEINADAAHGKTEFQSVKTWDKMERELLEAQG